MALLPSNRLRHLLRRDMDQLFDDNFLSNFFKGDLFPPVDVYETKNEVVVSCELPGLKKKDDVEILVEDERVFIRAQVEKAQEEEQENRYYSERYYGSVQRSIPLPVPVMEDQARANYKNGVLEIRIPKAKEEKGKKSIDIDFS